MGTMRASLMLGLCVLLVAVECIGAPIKLGCFTERIQQKPGVPSVWLVNFDDDLKTANVFVKDLGGILDGTDVSITTDTILFKFRTADGKKGDAFISRAVGTLMVSVEGSFDAVLANCRKQANAF